MVTQDGSKPLFKNKLSQIFHKSHFVFTMSKKPATGWNRNLKRPADNKLFSHCCFHLIWKSVWAAMSTQTLNKWSRFTFTYVLMFMRKSPFTVNCLVEIDKTHTAWRQMELRSHQRSLSNPHIYNENFPTCRTT